MTPFPARRAPLPLLLVLAAACGGDTDAPPASAPEEVTDAAVVDTARADTAAASEPEEIYYDLTEFAWYREGEALQHDARGHMPAGVPVVIEAAELEPAGSHEGVTYYRRPGRGDTLFVPVFPRYWQPFVPAGR